MATNTRKNNRTIEPGRAAEMVGPVSAGCEIFGLTMGKFSLIELLIHCLDTTGPADLHVCTWAIAEIDVDCLKALLDAGRIRSVRFIIGEEFAYAKKGPSFHFQRVFKGQIVATRAHSKFFVLTNADWNLAVRSSMNLNLNRKIENYEISDCRQTAAFLLSLFEEAWRVKASSSTQKVPSWDLFGAPAVHEQQIEYTATPKGIQYGAS